MKRSEMIKEIKLELEQWHQPMPSDTVLSLILNAVENAGMLPPDYERVEYVRPPQAKGVARIRVRVYEWEDEE
jgi:hypothetical protein